MAQVDHSGDNVLAVRWTDLGDEAEVDEREPKVREVHELVS